MKLFTDPAALGLEQTFVMTTAPAHKTFYYRREHKRVIESRVLSEWRLRGVAGPLIYAVTDCDGVLRYVGKWVSATPLYARWFRHSLVHHQTSSRTFYLRELDAGRTPLTVWSLSASELRQRFLVQPNMTDTQLIENLEGLWIQRWGGQLWNKHRPPVAATFSDGEYWK
ncbi:GIY-YIG nuclease family protein [Variovorax saccharolyticus]|uniref:GIY-YIG nuclease family protein n=1 Tax=Variovorax saccharolyticus TaxID=3053516 RepID=UPI00257680A7|nr:GIY-YIG nuclease family protein [Variovorax sp. J31P216]MDM0025916.1 GIY-YIG nuclease family protein [Variovorax sp. J31P216]